MTGLLDLPADVLDHCCRFMDKTTLQTCSLTCRPLSDIAVTILFRSMKIYADSSATSLLRDVRLSTMQHVRHLKLVMWPFQRFFQKDGEALESDYGTIEIQRAQDVEHTLTSLLKSLPGVICVALDVKLNDLDDLEKPDRQARWALYSGVFARCKQDWAALTGVILVLYINGAHIWRAETWSELISPLKYLGRVRETRIYANLPGQARGMLDGLPVGHLGEIALHSFEPSEVMRLPANAHLTSVTMHGATPKSVHDFLRRFGATLEHFMCTDVVNEVNEDDEDDLVVMLHQEYRHDTTIRQPVLLPKLRTLTVESEVPLWALVGLLQLVRVVPTCELDIACNLYCDEDDVGFDNLATDMGNLAEIIRQLDIPTTVYLRYFASERFESEITWLRQLRDVLCKPSDKLHLEVQYNNEGYASTVAVFHRRLSSHLLRLLSRENLNDDILDLSLGIYPPDLVPSDGGVGELSFRNARKVSLSLRLLRSQNDTDVSLDNMLARLDLPRMSSFKVDIMASAKFRATCCCQISAIHSNLSRFTLLEQLDVYARIKSRQDEFSEVCTHMMALKQACEARGIRAILTPLPRVDRVDE